MLESDPSLQTYEVNMFRLTKRNNQFFIGCFFVMKKQKKEIKKTYKEKYLAGFKFYLGAETSSASHMVYCSLTLAQVSLNPTVLLKTNFSAEESLSTQK